MVYSIEQNTFIVDSYCRSGRFINYEWTYSYSLSDYKNKFPAKYPHIQYSYWLTHIGQIVNRFLTTVTVSKATRKSSGRPPISDEIVEDLEKRSSIRSLFISTIWCTVCVCC
jgi:hypothetical protein